MTEERERKETARKGSRGGGGGGPAGLTEGERTGSGQDGVGRQDGGVGSATRISFSGHLSRMPFGMKLATADSMPSTSSVSVLSIAPCFSGSLSL